MPGPRGDAIFGEQGAHLAAAAGSPALIRRLHHAAPTLLTARSRYAYLPAHHAAADGNLEALQLLLALAPGTAAAVICTGKGLLHCAARGGRLAAVEWLLRRLPPGAALARDEWGQVPLVDALDKGELAIAELLLKAEPRAAEARWVLQGHALPCPALPCPAERLWAGQHAESGIC